MPTLSTPKNAITNHIQLAQQIKQWGNDLGFQQVAITDTELNVAGDRLNKWLENNYQGDMSWMAEHGDKRYTPEKLLPQTVRVISFRLNYLHDNNEMIAVLKQDNQAYISRYALGRDYHKLIRKRLAKIAQLIKTHTPNTLLPNDLIQRPFVDSAPVMEKPLAVKAGLGWMGKHTLTINSEAGSWFFLGELYTNLPLPIDESTEIDQCGKCKACITVCPTDAFPEPYVLDAKRCISYLTIENKGSIPEEFRKAMGNRVFGCDDCQIFCPWNRESHKSQEDDFQARHSLDDSQLTELFNWTESEFLSRTEGSPIRRIGYERWLRNLAIGLGNATTNDGIISALTKQRHHHSELVREHVIWALAEHQI